MSCERSGPRSCCYARRVNLRPARRAVPGGLALAAALHLVSCSPPPPLVPPVPAVDTGDPLLDRVLAPLAARHRAILASPGAYRFQLLLGVPVERGGATVLERHGYRVDAEYFYPASAIKTCAAVAALELLGELAAAGVPAGEETPLVFHPLFADEVLEDRDPTNVESGAITAGHELRKLFLVSDNQAFNRLFELTGREAVNRSMWRAGLASARIRHRLEEARTPAENRRSPRVDLLLPDGRVHTIPERLAEDLPPNDQPGLAIGRAHVAGGVRVERPLDFALKNRMSLADLQDLAVLLLRPELLGDRPRFRLAERQLERIRRAMSEAPHESQNPVYAADEHPEEAVKFLLPGLRRAVPAERLEVYDKTGRAYGFTVENAYVVDRASGRSFFLAAVLYTNPNQTLNDDDYAYQELADPFFAELGESAAKAILVF